MTADVELLPCPFCGGEAHLERQGHVCCKTMFCRGAGAFDNYGTPTEQNASAVSRWNTRANVAHATAAKDAEIEALRAEVALLRVGAENERLHHRGLLDRERERAERLEEALRAFPAEPNPYTYRIAHAKARAALDPTAAQEGKESFWPKLPGSGGPDWTGHD